MLTQEEQEHEVNDFIQGNKFSVINNNPTQDYQKAIKQTPKQCNNIIQKETI
jgi:hypothetical protein